MEDDESVVYEISPELHELIQDLVPKLPDPRDKSTIKRYKDLNSWHLVATEVVALSEHIEDQELLHSILSENKIDILKRRKQWRDFSESYHILLKLLRMTNTVTGLLSLGISFSNSLTIDEAKRFLYQLNNDDLIYIIEFINNLYTATAYLEKTEYTGIDFVFGDGDLSLSDIINFMAIGESDKHRFRKLLIVSTSHNYKVFKLIYNCTLDLPKINGILEYAITNEARSGPKIIKLLLKDDRLIPKKEHNLTHDLFAIIVTARIDAKDKVAMVKMLLNDGRFSPKESFSFIMKHLDYDGVCEIAILVVEDPRTDTKDGSKADWWIDQYCPELARVIKERLQ
jgi:hypothetical protein